MKINTFVLPSIICLATLIILGSCTTTQNPSKMVFERFCGTWANEAYEPEPGLTKPEPAKWIFNPDGTFVAYHYLVETELTEVGSYTVEKRWTDSDGNSWYHVKIKWALVEPAQYWLFKIDKYNSFLETNLSNIDYPTTIDPKDWHSTYAIFYRY